MIAPPAALLILPEEAAAVHELATNSLTYGALWSPTGTLDIACSSEETDAVVVWTERGGPPVAEPAGVGGYGITQHVCSTGRFNRLQLVSRRRRRYAAYAKRSTDALTFTFSGIA